MTMYGVLPASHPEILKVESSLEASEPSSGFEGNVMMGVQNEQGASPPPPSSHKVLEVEEERPVVPVALVEEPESLAEGQKQTGRPDLTRSNNVMSNPEEI